MKSSKYVLFIVFFLIQAPAGHAQPLSSVSLWPDGVSGANPEGGEEIIEVYELTGDHLISNVHNPSITPYI